MPTFVYMTRCDGCGHCVDICPSDIIGKILHRKTVCHIHDENNESHVGDTVEIVECAPMSRLKRWKLVRIVKKSNIVDLVAMRAAEKAQHEAEMQTTAKPTAAPAK